MALGPFEEHVRGLKPAWLRGDKAKSIMGGLVRVMADIAAAWADRANRQHLPLDCEVEALPLLGSEMTVPQGVSETDDHFRTRATKAIVQRQKTGTPRALLLALHYAGFPGGVLIQQNGRTVKLVDGEPDYNDPQQVLGTTNVSPYPNYPTGHPMFYLGSDDDFNSRWTLIFDGVSPSAFRVVGRATFTGAEDGINVAWPTATWRIPFDDLNYEVMVGMPASDGPVAVTADDSGKTKTGIRIAASAPFTGTVDVLAWPVGSHPFAWLPAAELARLRDTIRSWRPSSRTCMGVNVPVISPICGWPVGTMCGGGVMCGASDVVHFDI